MVTVIAHDYFTQKGGAERVAVTLVEEFRPARLLAAVIDRTRTFPLAGQHQIQTSALQHFRLLRRDPRYALPLFPIIWRMFRPVDADVLICSSSGWSHALRVSPRCFKVVYCHNPARWLYQPNDYFRGASSALRLLAWALSPSLRRLDSRAARSADLYVANSSSVAARIESAYGIKAVVIPPPVSFRADGPKEAITGVPRSYFLAVSRARGYKNVDVLISAFRAMPDRNLVIVGDVGSEAPANVMSVRDIPDAQLKWLYEGARALISISFEDFGLTPLEANLFGVPAIVLRAGGFLDTVTEGVNGTFVDAPTAECVIRAVRGFSAAWDSTAIKHHVEQFQPATFSRRLRILIDHRRSLQQDHHGDAAKPAYG